MDKLIRHLESLVTEHRRESFEKVLENRTRYITLAIEDIYQSHNASAVVRSCDCFGIQDIHVIERKNPFHVNHEIALGASKWLTISNYIQSHSPVQSAIHTLKGRGYRIVATLPDPKATPLPDFDLEKGPIALFFGTELGGLSKEAIEMADEFMYIPMFGFTESLNISVSAAIILDNLTNKLRNSAIQWKINEADRKLIYLDWLKKSIKKPDEIINDFLRRNE